VGVPWITRWFDSWPRFFSSVFLPYCLWPFLIRVHCFSDHGVPWITGWFDSWPGFFSSVFLPYCLWPFLIRVHSVNSRPKGFAFAFQITAITGSRR
jgi:hypothetical protein